MKKYKRKKKVEEEVEKPVAGKKNTRKWCKGKVGREHKLEWEKSSWGFSSTYVHICTVCGKHLDYCFESFWRFGKDKKCICGNHKDK